jgi:hypothetical protein
MLSSQQQFLPAVGELTEAAAPPVSLSLLAQSGCTPEGAEIIELGAREDVVKGITSLTIILAVALCGTTLTSIAQAQGVDLVAHLRSHQMELRVTGEQLDGPAAAWLREEASKVQFLFIGEEHDTREIPLIAGALWRDLIPLGYRHVAIEAGQWLGGRLDEYARSGDPAPLARFKAAALPRRPNIAVPPSSDEDIALFGLLGRVDRPCGAQDSPLIWGLDHELNLTPLLERLRDLTPDPDARRNVNELLSKVGASERSGHYDVRPYQAEVTALARGFSPRPGTETSQILDAIDKRAAFDRGDDTRGAVMKRLFLRNYRAAQAAGEDHPRVMLRLGAWHGKRGLGFKFTDSPLANFVAEFAVGEETRMLNVRFISCSDSETGPPGRARPSPQERIWTAPFKQAAASPWTLFDLRGLRPQLRDGSLDVRWELAEVVTGYDAVVWLRATEPSHFSGGIRSDRPGHDGSSG